MSNQLDKIKGSIPPLITPFKNGEVDFESYQRNLDFQIKDGSHGILVNGTTAEPATLSVEERNDIMSFAVEKTAGRVPVIAASGSQSLKETQALTKHAANLKVDALLIVTPYYIKPPQRGLIEYYLKVTENIDIPWMIYHIPGRTAVSVTMDTVRTLKSKSPNFIGMKHAVNDLGFVTECLNEFPDFKIFVGLESLSFPMMAIGAVGLMNAVGNLRPRPLSDMCEAVWRNDLNAAKKIHNQLFMVNEAVFYDTNPIPMKYMMKRMGLIKENEHRLPMVPADKALELRLDKILDQAKLI